MSAGEFLTTTTQMLSSWSEIRSGSGPNSVCVQYRLMPEMQLLKAVDALLKTKPVIAYKKHGTQHLACVRSDGGGITAKVKYFILSMTMLEILSVHALIKKNYVCVHTIGIATIYGKFTLPEEAITGGLGIKRGPGRPKK